MNSARDRSGLPPEGMCCPVRSADFGLCQEHAERAIGRVLFLSAIAMVVEIVTGLMSGSMALLADGWHMGTHVAAMGISAFAYRFIRRNAMSAHYSFGPGKVSYLAAYSSSLLLAGVAVSMLFEAVSRLREPLLIHHDEALLVAVLGLIVNVVSAWLLHGHEGHDHAHDHDHEGSHAGHGHDHNLRAAYMHVIADALTSLAAIFALIAGKWGGMDWLDPVVAAASGLIILRWAWHLARDSAGVLLDREVGGKLGQGVREQVNDWGGRVIDMHLWLLAPRRHALVITIAGEGDLSVLRECLEREPLLAHVTIDLIGGKGSSVASQQSI